MARGPFQGTFSPNQQPTVVTAPDGLVFINGETDLLGCPSCNRKFDLNKYITSIQVDLSIESVPGSASLSLAIPRHTVDDFYVDGRAIITPMMEVEIYAKGHFLVEGLPQYYPIFWGLVTEVSSDYSGGTNTVSINCADILKWWELCRMNINAAFTQATGQLGRSIMGNVLYGSNPYDVIWLLAQQSFGDIVVATGSLTSSVREDAQKATFTAALGSITQYWNERFTKIRSNLLLYGVQGQSVRGDSLYETYGSKGGAVASTAVRDANGGPDGSQITFDPTGPEVVAFRTQFGEAGQVNFWQSEYQTKLEIAQAAKDALGYEFYMDVTGDIVFKPPFYNLDVISNKPLSWIQDVDIISMNLSESEAEVVTQLTLQGSFQGTIEYGCGEETTPYTSVVDYHLLRQYGWRPQQFNSEFLGSPLLMFHMGMDLLDRYNSRRHRGNITIPVRPELRLGFPIYLAPMDQVWYVAGISHSIQFGSQATTTLTLTARREKFVAPRGIGRLKGAPYQAPPNKKQATPVVAPIELSKDSQLSRPAPTVRSLQRSFEFSLDVGDAAETPPKTPPGPNSPHAPLMLRNPKTGRIMGYPNVVMAYTRPFAHVDEKDLKFAAGQKDKQKTQLTKQQVDERQKGMEADFNSRMQKLATYQQVDATRENHLTNRYSYGLNSAGVYIYAHDEGELINEFLLFPRDRLKVSNGPENLFGQGKGDAMFRPVSDCRGFELIGHFRYGRGVALRDGGLVISNDSRKNRPANVDIQLAISGTLFDMLAAQQAGITTGIEKASNPSDAVNRMAPDGLDMAAVSPDTKKPEVVPGRTNLIATATLGTSFEQVGVGLSIEATQLSKALTLNEMAVKWDNVRGASQCGCSSGRPDLWFISQGLSLKVGRGSVVPRGAEANIQEVLDTYPDQTQRAAVQASDKAVQARLEQEILADPAYAADLALVISKETSRLPDKDQAAAAAKAREQALIIRKADVSRDLYQKYLQEDLAAKGVKLDPALQVSLAKAVGSPTVDGLDPEMRAPSVEALQTMVQVESYLAQLYSALDAPHQEMEKIIRGEYAVIPERNPIEVRFGTEAADSSGISPPFSPVSRSLGGDPAAIALQGASAAASTAKAWEQFGTNLKTKSQRAKLQGEITLWNKDLVRLTAERARLQKGLHPDKPNTTLVVDGRKHSLQDQVEALDRQILALQTQVAQNNQQLSEVARG